MKKKYLSMAVAGFIMASASNVFAAEADEVDKSKIDEYAVEETVVEADRMHGDLPGGMVKDSNRVGILGDIKAVDVPFTERQYSRKTIELFDNPNQPMNGVLANNPSIVITSVNPLTTDFSMRGINMNGTQYTLNNVPSMFSQFMTIPMHVVESVDIISGPNTVLNGATNCQNGANNDGRGAPGRLNATTKKATDKDINRYIQKFSGRGTLTENLEVGRRFGKNKEWGVLLNVRHEDGNLAMKGGKISDKSIFINIDRRGKKSKTNIFGGYFDKKVEGAQRWLIGTDISSLPSIPDLKNNIGFDGEQKNVYGYLMTVNHEQKISDSWSAFANMGFAYNKQHFNDFSAATVRLNNQGQLSNPSGSTNNKFRDYYHEGYTEYIQVGGTNETKIKDGKNQLSFAYDYMHYRNRSAQTTSTEFFTGDIYNGITFNGKKPDVSNTFRNTRFDRETVHSFTIADRIEYKKSTLYVGLQYRNGTYDQVSVGKPISNSSWNPTYAYAYKPTHNSSIYVSYATGFTRPRIVTGSYNNVGEVFAPVKNKQLELGFKYENGGVLHSLALFQTTEASYIAEGRPGELPHEQVYTQEGKNKYKGLEYYAAGKLAPKWNFMGGFMMLNGKREKMAKGSEHLEGSRVTGVPKFNFVLALEYEMDKRNSIYGRINSCTNSVLNNRGVKTPGYTTVDLGYTYKMKLKGDTNLKLNATCFNVFGKDYWLARGSTNSWTLGAPRTFVVSATIDW